MLAVGLIQPSTSGGKSGGTNVVRILVTGGAGFLGSAVAIRLQGAFPASRVFAADNLRRRGSELNLARLKAHGVEFLHADVRSAGDLEIGAVDLVVECSAEPSVMAGRNGDVRYLLDTNLGGALNCLEIARQRGAAVVFISSSRIYPFDKLASLPLRVDGNRYSMAPDAALPPGLTAEGVATDFALPGRRTFYGASKLAAELLVQEYADVYGVPSVIFRCGVIAGPWQMGKVDQGFAALWVARHIAGSRLDYIGFGGEGHQVRDVLHIDDACDLVASVVPRIATLKGEVFNAGGGLACSVSLREMTDLCRDATGRQIAIGSVRETRPGDIPWYITDNREVSAALGWRPSRSAGDVVRDIAAWLRDNPTIVSTIFK